MLACVCLFQNEIFVFFVLRRLFEKPNFNYEYCTKVVCICSYYKHRLLVAVIAYFNESTSDANHLADKIVSLSVIDV